VAVAVVGIVLAASSGSESYFDQGSVQFLSTVCITTVHVCIAKKLLIGKRRNDVFSFSQISDFRVGCYT
jgi:hypothetical protein